MTNDKEQKVFDKPCDMKENVGKAMTTELSEDEMKQVNGGVSIPTVIPTTSSN